MPEQQQQQMTPYVSNSSQNVPAPTAPTAPYPSAQETTRSHNPGKVTGIIGIVLTFPGYSLFYSLNKNVVAISAITSIVLGIISIVQSRRNLKTPVLGIISIVMGTFAAMNPFFRLVEWIISQ